MENLLGGLLSRIVTIPFFRRPWQKLDQPEYYGMENTQNLRIPSKNEEEELGAWLVQPNQDAASEDKIVIYYLHGNAETRSQDHRKELYKVFQREGYHVLALDYRGYGDSSALAPNEETMTEDALAGFNWLIQKYPCTKTNIIVYGHSMGTGVAMAMGAKLATGDYARQPSGYVLEAPFNCLLDEVNTFKISYLVGLCFDLDDLVKKAKVSFDSSKAIKLIDQPILILHAEDDNVVPFQLGKKLYEDNRELCNVEFVTFEAVHGYRHVGIGTDPRFSGILKEFVVKCKDSAGN